MNNKPTRKRIETSKKILIGEAIGVVLLSLFTCFMCFYTKTTDILQVLIPSVFTAFATATGFYYNKAKAENKIKLEKLYGKQPDDNEEYTSNS